MNLAMDLIREALLGGSGGGGGGGMELLFSDELEASTTSTSAVLLKEYDVTETIDFQEPNVWFLIHVRDKAGMRAGYFCGSDRIAINTYPLTSRTGYGQASAFFHCRLGSNGTDVSFNPNTYGVYGEFSWAASSRKVRIYTKYATGMTIDGTYVVEVYKLPAIGGKLY